MSEEKLAGILVDPMGPAEALSPYEYKMLKQFLTIHRAEDARGRAFWDGIFHLLWRFENVPEDFTDKQNVQSAVISYLQDHEGDGNHDGLLTSFKSEHFFTLEIEELWTLVHTLTALRAGGWFAKWLMIQVANIANATRPEERAPSPLFIAGTLTEAIDEWNSEVAAAKTMVERRPDLLLPAQPEAPRTMAEALKNAREVVAGLEREVSAAEKYVGLKPGQRIGEKAPRPRKRHKKAA